MHGCLVTDIRKTRHFLLLYDIFFLCRNMLQGPWKEAGAPEITLHIDDENVNGEAVCIALAYLYGHQPKLNDGNAFRVLAAASFLDLRVSLFLFSTDFLLFVVLYKNVVRLVYHVRNFSSFHAPNLSKVNF